MLAGYHPLVQSLLGTCLTWGLTAAGAALVFVFQGGGGKVSLVTLHGLGGGGGVGLPAQALLLILGMGLVCKNTSSFEPTWVWPWRRLLSECMA